MPPNQDNYLRQSERAYRLPCIQLHARTVQLQSARLHFDVSQQNTIPTVNLRLQYSVASMLTPSKEISTHELKTGALCTHSVISHDLREAQKHFVNGQKYTNYQPMKSTPLYTTYFTEFSKHVKTSQTNFFKATRTLLLIFCPQTQPKDLNCASHVPRKCQNQKGEKQDHQLHWYPLI